ncbi:hypothetical protein [Kitasatospora sp. NPDC088134]|uniref:hypothetical protein n=1 Tax=Kitasatospora sp. NPDC088134 TaxID=3364071 RepID=UPI003822AAC2
MYEAVPWQQQLFDQNADRVRSGLGQGLRNMHANARAAQEEASVRPAHPYGAARYTGQFERIADELITIPGARLVKPRGFGFELVLVGKGLIYPFRYAKTQADVRVARIPHTSVLIKELLANFGTAPDTFQEALEFDGFETDDDVLALRAGLADLPPDTKLVLVPFACNVGGLLESYWGVASLGIDGTTLQWASTPEALPVPDQATRQIKLHSVPEQGVTVSEALTGFDQGEEPPVFLSSRPDSDVKLDLAPETEEQPIEPRVNEDDEK